MASLEEKARELDRAMDASQRLTDTPSVQKGNGKDVSGHKRRAEGHGRRDPMTEVLAPFAEDGLDAPPILPSLDEFMEMEFPEPQKLLGPIHNEHIVHAIAKTGVGKTHLANAIAMQLHNGESYWHWECPVARSVGYVDGEMPGRQLQDRFKMYRRRKDRAEFRIMNAISWASRHGLPHPNLADPRWQDQFMLWTAGLEVLIFDNVMSLVSVPGESMSSDQFWKPIYDFNLRVRAEGKTIIWIDHANAQNLTFGTKTKEWLADLVIQLSHEGPDETGAWDSLSTGCEFTMAFPKRRGLHGDDVAPVELSLTQDREGFAMWTHRFSDEKKKIEACLLKENGMSLREIAKEIEVPKSTVARWLSDVEK